MGTYESLNALVGVIAVILLCGNVVQALVAAVRTRRTGASLSSVGASMTAQLIGLGVAVSGAVGGGFILFMVFQPYDLHAVLHLGVQVCGALTGSWLVGHVYFRWLAQPVRAWFAGEGEEANQYGR